MKTVVDLCTLYLIKYAVNKKPRSQAEDARQIKAYILPAMGYKSVESVQYEDVESLHLKLKSVPYQANRVLALLSKMFALAEKWRLRPHGSNPCRGVDRYKEMSRRRYLTPEEAPKVAAILATHEESHPLEVAYVYLLLLSGARPEEIGRARWDWLELSGNSGVLRLPDSKTGARSVYLSPRLVRLLAGLPRAGVCILDGADPHALWGIVRSQAGVPDLRLYDLRHSFASAALAEGYTLDQIGELLGHRSPSTTKRYAHLMEGKAFEVAAGTSARLEAMLNPPASVLSIASPAAPLALPTSKPPC